MELTDRQKALVFQSLIAVTKSPNNEFELMKELMEIAEKFKPDLSTPPEE